MISFLLLILVHSCREPEKPVYYMPQEFKDYVDFPVGSWWVYEDSITMIIDSICLNTVVISTFEPSNMDYKFEKLDQTFSSSNSDSNFGGGSFFDISTFEYSANGYYFDISNGITDIQCAYLFSVYDTLLINNTPYFNVVCIKRSSCGGNGCYYWVKHIGLIKKIDSSHVWQLKSYNIN